MTTLDAALVIPTVGARALVECLAGVAALHPPPRRVVVVHSGNGPVAAATSQVELIRPSRRLGFAAAVNLGLSEVVEENAFVAVLNDDAVPAPGWLGALCATLEGDDRAAAAQGTIVDARSDRVDGRGIDFDRWALPIQVDRGLPLGNEPATARTVPAVSGTAALYRSRALIEARLGSGAIFDPVFGSYHEDLDLGLRLGRQGWLSWWLPGAPCSHLGSESGAALVWRHPWWVLANRWRALAGNLTGRAVLTSLPRLLRGEARAVATLTRRNPRTPLVAAALGLAAPRVLLTALRRTTPGPRLRAIPESRPCG